MAEDEAPQQPEESQQPKDDKKSKKPKADKPEKTDKPKKPKKSKKEPRFAGMTLGKLPDSGRVGEQSELGDPIQKLGKDLQNAARLMGRAEVRYLVDLYYQIQKVRVGKGEQIRAADELEPISVLSWIGHNTEAIEKQLRLAFGAFVDEYRVGRWLTSICGVGPVIAAGLLAHLDVRNAETYGHFVSFAGMDPNKKWEAGQKRPWNAKLKVLMWKAGTSFIKAKSSPKDFYGQRFDARKAGEWHRNLSGALEKEAQRALREKNWKEGTNSIQWYRGRISLKWARMMVETQTAVPLKLPPEALMKGETTAQQMLPPGHITARSIRWIAKLFLSHVHHAMYEDYYGRVPPLPYAFVYGTQGVAPAVLARDNGLCAYCGAKAEKVDHILPGKRGGLDNSQNLVACCEPCNQRKADRTPKEAGMMYHASFDVAKLSLPINDAGDHRHFVAPPGWPNEQAGKPLAELLDKVETFKPPKKKKPDTEEI